MKLVVGLGNPGTQYAGTRHNVGFEVLRVLVEKYGKASPRARFQGETVEAKIGDEKVLLLTPLTFMNLSGGSVLAARDFYKIENENLLIVCDDFALPLAKLRFRAKGTSGGQKGLEDARRMYERLLKNKPGDQAARAQYVESCLQLASIERSLGAYDRAEKAYQQAMDMLDQLVRESNNSDHQSRYLTVLVARTNMEHDQGQQQKGRQYLQLAEPFVKPAKALTSIISVDLGR